MIILVYVDDCIIFAKKKSQIDDFLESLKNGPEKFDFTDEGSISNYLGVEILKREDGIELHQPHLIDRIIQSVNFDQYVNGKSTPVIKPNLTKDSLGNARKDDWHYRSAIGMLTYLEKSTRPDISMAVHACARFCNDPKLSHERAVKRIVKYLVTTRERGIVFTPDKSKGLECYVDADFAGGWNNQQSDDPANLLSRTGFVIYYYGCPIYWQSKLQTEIALSTTEAEYIALLMAMKQIIPMTYLLKELDKVMGIGFVKPSMKSKLFEKEFKNIPEAVVHKDNRSCIAVAKCPKMTPRTKHIALKYHHFRSHVEKKLIAILPISTEDQIADMLTKPLNESMFNKNRKILCRY